VTPAGLRTLVAGEGPGDEPEVVVMMGIQGAGKSSEVARYLERGYARLNRDQLGGDLDGLIPKLGELLASGQRRVVLDNTYATRVSRYRGDPHGARARRAGALPLHMATPIDEAYANVVLRILERYGKLLGPEELKELAKDDPNLPPPAAMAKYAASFEAPHVDEGFAVVEAGPVRAPRRPAVHGQGPAARRRRHAAGHGAARSSRAARRRRAAAGPPRGAAALRRRGLSLFFVSNQSGVASEKLSKADAEAAFARTIELLGLPVAEVMYCPHPAFPVGCFCRKPLPGLGVSLIQRHRLAREHLIMVGDMDSDRDFARALGVRYVDAGEFFARRASRVPIRGSVAPCSTVRIVRVMSGRGRAAVRSARPLCPMFRGRRRS
jgi:HAD superfamily hydrolase (TIGR01662 family)